MFLYGSASLQHCITRESHGHGLNGGLAFVEPCETDAERMPNRSDDLRWSELLEISTYIKIYQNDSVWYRMFLHKQTPRHISKSLRLRNLTTRNPIQFDLGQCGLTVPGCRELDNILLLHPNYRKALGMFGLHAENAEAITIHYISSHFKSFQGNHQIQGSIHRAVSCYALILCRIWDV